MRASSGFNPRTFGCRAMDTPIDPEMSQRLLVLLKKTEAQVIADWKWPLWRREDAEPPAAET